MFISTRAGVREKSSSHAHDLISMDDDDSRPPRVVQCLRASEYRNGWPLPGIVARKIRILSMTTARYRATLVIEKGLSTSEIASFKEAIRKAMSAYILNQLEVFEFDVSTGSLSPLWSTDETVNSLGEPETIPASDRIVTINHNSPEFTDAISQLDTIRTEVRNIESNEFDIKDALLESLDLCATMLKATAVFADQAYNFILETIQRIRRLAWEIAATSIAITSAVLAVGTLLAITGIL